LLAVGCGQTDSADSLVVVTVTAGPGVSGVTQLQVDVFNAGLHDLKLFPPAQSTKTITFDTSFAVNFPKSRSGELDITITGLDALSIPDATGSGSVPIVVGGRADRTIHLDLIGQADAGVPSVDAGNYDAIGSDPENAEVASIHDVLRAGPDAQELGGSGGIMGTGGRYGTGGVTGSGGAIGTGGIAVTGGLMGSGGAASSGGR